MANTSINYIENIFANTYTVRFHDTYILNLYNRPGSCGPAQNRSIKPQ